MTNDSLAFFADYFRPLSERVFGRKAAAEESGRDAEAKVWEVVVGQIWDCFPGFCEMPRDLKLVSLGWFGRGLLFRLVSCGSY